MTSRKDIFVKDPDILGGTPVFRGTRVPLQALFDSIESGETLEEFLEGIPLGVPRDGRCRPRTSARTIVKGSRHEPLILLFHADPAR